MGVGISISLVCYLAALISGGIGIPSNDGSKNINAVYVMAAFAILSLIVSFIFIIKEWKKERRYTGYHTTLILGDIIFVIILILIKFDGSEFPIVYSILLGVCFIIFVLVISACAIFLRDRSEGLTILKRPPQQMSQQSQMIQPQLTYPQLPQQLLPQPQPQPQMMMQNQPQMMMQNQPQMMMQNQPQMMLPQMV